MIGSKISKRYAKALLSLGQEDGNFQRYGEDLREFSLFCDLHREFREVVASRIYPVEERRKVLQAILEKSTFTGTVKNFLYLLLDKNRMGAIEDITRYYQKLTDEISDIARATVISTGPLKGGTRDRLEKVLGDLTSKKVMLQEREDKSLIGGIVVKIGDLVLDGSIKAQLEGLKESLKRGEYS
ncbi:MAG: ATP synthase F1 subunit delta [Deltaproteobacteria bacterium]|nr:ATP synthase F1 subunit delta [Deltaproteobacteria bacterium]